MIGERIKKYFIVGSLGLLERLLSFKIKIKVKSLVVGCLLLNKYLVCDFF